MDDIAIGKTIRALRRKRHLTQEQFAERIGRSVSFMGHIERGSRKMSLETLLAIADALDVSVDAILDRDRYEQDREASARLLLELALEMALKMSSPKG